MREQLEFFLSRVRERLWVKPLLFCLLSIGAALLAHGVDDLELKGNAGSLIPDVTRESIQELLKITAASMLVIATFAVSAMVSAYSSAARTATPRAFSLVITDDVSQNALSIFVGTFIYSVVALAALMNGYYGKNGRFLLFALTLLALTAVIAIFVRWVDRIARLGRLESVVAKVEHVALSALHKRQAAPTLCGLQADPAEPAGRPVFACEIGYVQHINMQALQACAEKYRLAITVAALPGIFTSPDREIARVAGEEGVLPEAAEEQIAKAFVIGRNRTYDEDPRFGLVVLAEIACRALSPAVNDPGTAITVIGAYVRLFSRWAEPPGKAEMRPIRYDRVRVPRLSLSDLFDDAFTPLARDGAGVLEVQLRLQKALRSLAEKGNDTMRTEAVRHARLAIARAEKAMALPQELERVRNAAMPGAV